MEVLVILLLTLLNGFFSLSEQPQDASGAVVTVRATFSAQGPLISYAT